MRFDMAFKVINVQISYCQAVTLEIKTFKLMYSLEELADAERAEFLQLCFGLLINSVVHW